MNLATADDCRAVLRPVAAAMFEGQEAEAVLAAAVGADGEPPSRPGSAFSAVHDMKAWADRRRLAGSRAAAGDRAEQALASFVDLLDELPAAVEIERVGTCVVVPDDVRGLAAGWTSRLGAGGEQAAVYGEVRSALAALRGAVMRLELGVSRLG